MGFIDENFLLRGESAKRLYHDHAAKLPIIDYHCHLEPQKIAEDFRFKSLTELMLGGDHYKWRAMRAFGIDEELITGGANDREKFRAYAKMLPWCIGNPLYHWTHLELLRYFGIDMCLTPDNADAIFDECNRLLMEDGFSARGLIERSKVELICTTDDPCDELIWHEKIASDSFSVRVLPTFRPDRTINIGKPTFVPYIKSVGISSFEELCTWLSNRIDYFHARGCRLSDHGLDFVPYAEGNASRVFDMAHQGEALTEHDIAVYQTALLGFLAGEYAKRGWCMQLHIGAMRDNNKKMFGLLGPDTGFDAIGECGIAKPLSRLLDGMESSCGLPRTILYSLNPNDTRILAAVAGCFQSPPHRSKIHLGSAWWFNDTKGGMEDQLRAFAEFGVLGTFIGMLTDSRSFVSYTRHEYFRRILCSLIGGWVDSGEYPADFDMLGKIIEGICYYNAKSYFNF